ncbi:MAG: prephenate dehydrogenase [Candidatus Omnitrophica bacterium]|nr:prephenate dehydrogenase [Candidatus Omnitrophota bacterium]
MDLKRVKKIAIIGVGFMGGSLALALKKKLPYAKIWGFARSQKSFNKLKRLSLLDRVEKDLAKLVVDSDLVVFALPVKVICSYFKKVSPFLKEGATVIDLGSTKQLVEKSAKMNLPRSIDFIACHPLAGSEKSGAEFSHENLYQGSVCLITSSPKAKAAKSVKNFWQKLGCRVVFISASQHDKVLSGISHLPHLISFSLSELISEDYLKFSTNSFKDLTRIANSPALVWADIFISNSDNIVRDLKGYIKILKKYQALLKKGDRELIVKLITKVNHKQKKII